MALNTLKDLYLHELRDLYDAEHRLADLLPVMASKAHSGALTRIFEAHTEATGLHIRRLEKAFDDVGESPKRKTCHATIGLIREAEESFAEAGNPDVLDALLVAHAQRLEHYEMAAYGAARTYAKLLGHEGSADQLQTSLNEEGETNKQLTDLALKLDVRAKG